MQDCLALNHEFLFHFCSQVRSGFRGGFSTDSCLFGLSDFIKGEMGKGNLIGMVLIDLQKAFDTVDHFILLEKSCAMGVTSISWFHSYLSQRQCVEVNGQRPIFMEVTCGVSQGSIIGPQLFLMYINDMQISLNCKLALYADDSALSLSHKNTDVNADFLSDGLSKCKQWLVNNKLSLHVGKTECLLFRSSCCCCCCWQDIQV
jgi:ribonuclease P/MRP protein subunit RPP40